MTTDGKCPECSTELQTPNLTGTVTADNLDLKKLAGIENEKLPWHFKLLVGLLCLYMGWRIVDLFL